MRLPSIVHSARAGTAALLLPALLVGLGYAWLAYWQALSTDGGVFVYLGQTILRGGVPYVDAWDHKGPLLYLFNALGLAIAGGSLRGPLILEGVLTAGSLLASTMLWLRIANRLAVAVVGLFFAVTFIGWAGLGLRSETLLLPFQLLAYASLARLLVNSGGARTSPGPVMLTAVLVGVAFAIALLSRVNNGLGLLVAAGWLAVTQPGRRAAVLAGVAASSTAVLVPVFLYLWSSGAWPDFIDQYLRANVAYSSALSIDDRLKASGLLIGMITGSASWALLVAAAAVRTFAGGGSRALLPFVLILLADLVSQMTSGRGFQPYALVTLPGAATLALVLIGHGMPKPTGRSGPVALGLVLLAAAASSMTEAAVTLASARAHSFVSGGTSTALVRLIQAESSPGDRILLLGHDVRLLAASERQSATRLVYVWPFLTKYGMLGPEAVPVYVAEAKAGRPRIVMTRPELLDCDAATPRLWEPRLKPLISLCPWLAQGYERKPGLGGLHIWVRRR